MLPTPAHDGIRLMLPAFLFLAALAGWGAVWLADGLATLARRGDRPAPFRAAMAAAVLGWSAAQLAMIHPFELSYYNRLVGGPSGRLGEGLRAVLLVRRLQPPDPRRDRRRTSRGRRDHRRQRLLECTDVP